MCVLVWDWGREIQEQGIGFAGRRERGPGLALVVLLLLPRLLASSSCVLRRAGLGGGSFLSVVSLSLPWGRVARFSFLSLHLFSLLPFSLSFFLSFFPFCFLSLGVFSYTKLMVCV